ncbi:N-acetyltransferase [Nocardioides immobilis]|uniref:N-acetyltransferase n=2 Tax=Nocardioides immobilis TaxID=2049295 RepID=A0A417Y730_9ACTN|nr:N-acetyltransferase [Nocardioides immobilis]
MATNQVVRSTERLILGPWTLEDAPAALTIFGRPEVTHWLTPALEPIHDADGMRAALERWAEEDAEADPPVGHWSVRRREDDVLLGSITLRRMPPFQQDLELAWQFAPHHWGNGYATEAAQAVAAWAFENSAHELFAVMRPANERAEKLARRLGMQWVGETDKYYDLRLQVFRLRPPELLTSNNG